MIKRIIAGILAAALLCLCFGCGQKPAGETTTKKAEETVLETNKVESGGKIAVIVGDAEQEPELYPAAKQLSDAYGDTLMLLGYSASYYAVATGLTDSALAAARDPQVKALIFAGGVNGTANAAQRAREERDDLLIIVCNPLEGTKTLRDTADVILTVDFAALAQTMVDEAKSNGAENFIFYTTDRSLGLAALRELRSATESACKKAKIECKAMSCIDEYDETQTLETAKRYIAEDLQRRLETAGAKTAVFSTERTIQGAMAIAAAARGMTTPITFPLSPIILASSMDLDLTNHETDSAYALSLLQKAAAENGTAGKVRTWSFSVPIVCLQAAVDYACDAMNGEAEATEAGIQAYIGAHTDAEVTVTADGGVFSIDSTPVTLGK